MKFAVLHRNYSHGITRNVFFLRSTQIELIKYAQQHQLNNILIFEDDILLSNPYWIQQFCESQQQSSSPEWIVLKLGVNQKIDPEYPIKFINNTNDKDIIKYYHLNLKSWGAYAMISLARPSYQMLIDLFDSNNSDCLCPFDSYETIREHSIKYDVIQR